MHFAMNLGAGAILLALVSLPSCSRPSEHTTPARASRIHEQAVVIDAHAHPKLNEADSLSLGEKQWMIETELSTLDEGGLDAVFFNSPLLGPSQEGQPQSVEVLADIRYITGEIERFGHLAEIARSARDIQRINALERRAILLGIETPDPFGKDLGSLAAYYSAGVRMITFPLPPEAMGEPTQGVVEVPPLTPFGTRVVEEMNRLGMIIDVSHTPDRWKMDIISSSVDPVVASHINARALNNDPRQMPDSIIRAMVQKGGVICVTFYPGHISSDFPDQVVTVERLVDHIDHIVEVAGIDHVGFGSDFLGSETHTVGLESAQELPNLTRSLLERGYSLEEIEKIMGGNLLRLLERNQVAGS
jgi:membrane dipeptidase